MTTTPPDPPYGEPTGPAPPAAPEGPRPGRDQLRDLRRLRRSVADRKVAGVAAGIARHLDIDPVIVRVAFVVLAFFGGSGLLLYGGLWALLPEDGRQQGAIGLDDRTRTVAVVGVGAVSAMMLLGDALSGSWLPGAWPLTLVALVVAFFLVRRDQSAPPPSGPYTGASPWPAAGGEPASGAMDPAFREAAGSSTGQGAGYVPGPAPYPTAYDTGWPPGNPPPPPRRPRRRDRGPILFWSTCALVMLALGLLGVADVAGMTVSGAAYPALALVVIGVMLVVGAYYGRAGGLIFLGLVAALALAGSSASERWDGDVRTYAPTATSQVLDEYSLSAGDLVVDLSAVDDPEELNGRDLLVENGAGRVELILPEDLDTRVDAHAGVGQVQLDSGTEEGFGVETTGTHEGSLDADLDVEVRVGLGEVEVSYR